MGYQYAHWGGSLGGQCRHIMAVPWVVSGYSDTPSFEAMPAAAYTWTPEMIHWPDQPVHASLNQVMAWEGGIDTSCAWLSLQTTKPRSLQTTSQRPTDLGVVPHRLIGFDSVRNPGNPGMVPTSGRTVALSRMKSKDELGSWNLKPFLIYYIRLYAHICPLYYRSPKTIQLDYLLTG